PKLLLSAYTDLPHQADHVIEEVLLYDFSFVTPMGNCTEVDLERLSSGRNVAPVRAHHGTRHSAGKASDGAGPIAAREQDLVGTVWTRLSGNVLKRRTLSARWSCRPCVGGWAGQRTITSCWCRLSKVSQSWAFQESSRVCINSRFR